MNTLMTANREYSKRPADERFPSLDALIAHAEHEKATSKTVVYNLKDLKVVPSNDGDSVCLQSPKGQAKFTHWSFGNLSRILHAPAGYLRSLPPANISNDLNFGLQNSLPGSTTQLLVKANGGSPVLRAAAAETYGRVWDADLYNGVKRVVKGDKWGLPPVWPGSPIGGAYSGDRDSFLVYTNGGSIVDDPTISRNDDSQMYRGLLIRNSEVGASAVVIESILYRYICGNHMLWGAVVDKSFRRRHIGQNALRDTIRELGMLAHKWLNLPASADEDLIKLLAKYEIAHTEEGLIDELVAMGATKADAKTAYDSAVQFEAASPRSFWGISQGLTRVSQQTDYQDERFELDKLAMNILKRGRAKVAA